MSVFFSTPRHLPTDIPSIFLKDINLNKTFIPVPSLLGIVRNGRGEYIMNEGQSLKSKPIAVSVPSEMADWLEQNQTINRSKVFQDAVNLLMHPVIKRVSPQIILMMFMNFIISLAIIFVSLWMPAFSENQTLKLALLFLALILTVISIMTYRAEKQRIKRT